jgi:hypothetical protein
MKDTLKCTRDKISKKTETNLGRDCSEHTEKEMRPKSKQETEKNRGFFATPPHRWVQEDLVLATPLPHSTPIHI